MTRSLSELFMPLWTEELTSLIRPMFMARATANGCSAARSPVAGRDVVIATKFGTLFDETTRQVTGADASPEGIRKACEDSLRRLNTDYIDLYQFHANEYPAEKAAPVRETLETLVQAGKIRAYGWSTDYVDRAEVFVQGPKCTSIQFQLNVLDDNPAMIAFCEKHNLAAINRGPLAMGLLTGKYTPTTTVSADDVRGTKSPEWMKYFRDGKPNPEWISMRDAILEILTSEGPDGGARSARLELGPQPVDHSHPWLSHREAG